MAQQKRLTPPRLEALEDRTVLATGVGTFNVLTSTWTLRNDTSAGPADAGTFQFGTPGSLPVVGDWNGDGKADIGTFNPATATWTLKYTAEAGLADAGTFRFGDIGSIPVVGDFNGDGRDDIGTFHQATATWTIRYSASPGPAHAVFQFGDRNAYPVVGDWNGNGVDGIGTKPLNDNLFRLRHTASAGIADAGTFRFGRVFAYPVAGDWNGDGRDGIGTRTTWTNIWTLRETATPGRANAGEFRFGPTTGVLPVVGDWDGPAAPEGALATLHLKPIDINLLGLEVQTSPITMYVSAEPGEGKLLGNLLNTVSTLVDLGSASNALTTVLGSTIDLLNRASLALDGVQDGTLTNAPVSSLQVLELWVAPVHLDLLGAQIDTSPIRVTITAHAGPGNILGNVVTELANLFNPDPATGQVPPLNVDTLNDALLQLLNRLEQHLPEATFPSAPVEPTPATDGQILNLTVPPLDLNLLGLLVKTSPITVNATAETGPGALLGNVLAGALKALDATPQNLAMLNDKLNAVLAKVVGALNASTLTLPASAVDALPPALKPLVSDTLTGAPAGSTAPILDLVIAADGDGPPVDVNLLGLVVTTTDIDARILAETGPGQVLGNLLYNVANLANPGGSAGLLNLLNLLGSGQLNTTPGPTGTTPTGGVASDPTPLLTLELDPIELDLLGLEVRTNTITLTVSTRLGDGKLLGNLLTGVSTLLNTQAVSDALNGVLSTTIGLVNSLDLQVAGVGTGVFDTAQERVVQVLDAYIAPVHLDLLGLVVDTSPIHVTITARSGEGRVLGNVVTSLAHLFDPDPNTGEVPELNIDTINTALIDLLADLRQQIPDSVIPSAPVEPVTLGPGQAVSLTVPPLDLNLLGLILKTDPITVNAFTQTGDGMLLGNLLTSALDTLGATPQNLTDLSNNLNAILAKVVGVLNASNLILPTENLAELLPHLGSGVIDVLNTLALPTLIGLPAGSTTEVLHLSIASPTANGSPVDVNLMGLQVTTSNIDARLMAQTGDGRLLGNLLFNVAHLLDPNSSTTLLFLLSQLARLGL